MEAGWFGRMRWRRSGAWLWPTFAAAIVVEAVIGHLLPPSGDSQTLVAAGLLACVLNLLGVVLLSRPLGALLRRANGGLPVMIARNQAGTAVVLAIGAGLLVAGIAHHPSIDAHERDMQDAIARAQSWIGDRAPAEFRRNLQDVNAFAIEPGSVYRACVPSVDRARTFCVVVKTHLPLAQSVTFAGYEPNSVFAAGAG